MGTCLLFSPVSIWNDISARSNTMNLNPVSEIRAISAFFNTNCKWDDQDGVKTLVIPTSATTYQPLSYFLQSQSLNFYSDDVAVYLIEDDAKPLMSLVNRDKTSWTDFLAFSRGIDSLIFETAFRVETVFNPNTFDLNYSFERPSAMKLFFGFVSKNSKTDFKRYCSIDEETQSVRFYCPQFCSMPSNERNHVVRILSASKDLATKRYAAMNKFVPLIEEWLGFTLSDDQPRFSYEFLILDLGRRYLESLKPLLDTLKVNYDDDRVKIPGAFFDADFKNLVKSRLKKCTRPKKSQATRANESEPEIVNAVRQGLISFTPGKLDQITGVRWVENQDETRELRIGFFEEGNIHDHCHVQFALTHFLRCHAIEFVSRDRQPYFYLTHSEAKKLANVLRRNSQSYLHIEMIFRGLKKLSSYTASKTTYQLENDGLRLFSKAPYLSAIEILFSLPFANKVNGQEAGITMKDFVLLDAETCIKILSALQENIQQCQSGCLEFKNFLSSLNAICGVPNHCEFNGESYLVELTHDDAALLGPVLESLGATHEGNIYQILVTTFSQHTEEDFEKIRDDIRLRMHHFEEMRGLVKKFGEYEIRYGKTGPEIHFSHAANYSAFLQVVVRCSGAPMTFEAMFYAPSKAFLSQFRAEAAQYESQKKTTSDENSKVQAARQKRKSLLSDLRPASILEEPHRLWALKPVNLNDPPSVEVQTSVKDPALEPDLLILRSYYADWKRTWDAAQSERENASLKLK